LDNEQELLDQGYTWDDILEMRRQWEER